MKKYPMKFDHLGVVVNNLQEGRNHFIDIFSICKWTDEFHDSINKVNVQFGFDENDMCFEIIAPIDNTSPIYNVIKKRINILNHIAYKVDQIDKCVQHLQQDDFLILGEPSPAIAYHMKNIQFFYSKKFGYLLELIESPDHQHVISKNYS